MARIIELLHLNGMDRASARALLGIFACYSMIGVTLLVLRVKTRR